jgi:hypothetical protein
MLPGPGRFVIKYSPDHKQPERQLKLRILDNSIRLRLTQSEVDDVNAEGLVRGRVRFAGSNTFDYVLESSPATVKPEAHISNNVLTVRVPRMDIERWAGSEQVSIESEQGLDDGGYLKILVEKDFHCLAPRDGEDESDMFPHPDAGRETC